MVYRNCFEYMCSPIMILFYSTIILVEGGRRCSSHRPQPSEGVFPSPKNQTSGAPRGELSETWVPARGGCRQLAPSWVLAQLQSVVFSVPTVRTDWGMEKVDPGELNPVVCGMVYATQKLMFAAHLEHSEGRNVAGAAVMAEQIRD